MTIERMLLLASPDAAHGMLLTIVAAIAIGVLLIVLARRFAIPAIVVLLLGGIVLGPEGVGLVDPTRLGDGLQVIVALSVGLILFEGGLTLDLSGYRTAPAMIKRLLTLGVLITWFGTAVGAWLIYGLPWEQCVIAGSLVIVTGPTVIAPLLKRVKINAKLHSILHWEGVLIDPLGVFIALLCFEWIVQQSGQMALLNLIVRIGWGLAVGIAGGLVIHVAVKRRLVPEEMVNVFALGFAVLVFGLAEMVETEAGLLAVTVAGFVFGFMGSSKLKQVRQFKAELTDLLIGTLFILLASRLSFEQFQEFGVAGMVLVGLVMFVVRPLGIFTCSWRTDLHVRERVFLSWIAPRGIVAASMASLFAISFEQSGTVDQPRFVETFTYSVIMATIVLQGSTAGPIARWLGLKRPDPVGWLIVGAHQFARRLAQFIAERAELPVVLVDTNVRAIRGAQLKGVTTLAADARDVTMAERTSMQAVGNVLALTDNEDLNVRICQNWAEVVGPQRVYRCNPTNAEPEEHKGGEVPGRVLWPRLPRPSLLAGELMRGEATMLESGGPQVRLAQLATPVAAVINGRLAMEVDAGALGEANEDTRMQVLYVQRQADYLLRSLRPELILTLDVADREELIVALVDAVVKLRPALARDETVREVLDREASFPTTLGQGVAVPHGYSSALDGHVCAMARLEDAVDYGAPDGEPVRLVFLVLSPPGDPEGHLATLADIARLVLDSERREGLQTAETPLEVMQLVRAARAL